MTTYARALAVVLLACLAAPALGKNYFLHSPKLWTQQEKEQYEKENPPPKKEKDPVEKENEQIKKETEQVEKQKEQVKKVKEQITKDKERVGKEKEQITKAKEQVSREREQVKKEKELIKKEKERVRQERERIKKEKEQLRKNQVQVKDGVSYREVTVKKGDTVYGITRKYSKEGATYSETLKFNDIDDPDQISSGDTIKVPLFREKKEPKVKTAKPVKPLKPAVPESSKQQAAVKPVEKTVQKEKPTATKKPDAGLMVIPPAKPAQPAAQATAKQPVAQPAPAQANCVPPATFSNSSTAGQKLFEKAISLYRKGDCQNAIVLFNRYLAENANSLLAADASLLIADCYLKLSGK
jgi:TolA-binding protein